MGGFWKGGGGEYSTQTLTRSVTVWLCAEAAPVKFVEKPSPISAAKAVKNPAELEGMREAHLRDSVALATTLHWLESEVSCSTLFSILLKIVISLF